MRYLFYAKNGSDDEKIFYDSESGERESIIISPTIKLELSKSGTLEFSIIPTHPMYDYFEKMVTYVRVTQDDVELFRGRVLGVDDDMNMERKVQCEGDLAYLIDSLQPPQSATGNNSSKTPSTDNSSARSQYGSHVVAKSTSTMKVDLGETTATSNGLVAQFQKYIAQHNSMVEDAKKFTVGNVTVTTTESMSFTASGYRNTKSAIDSDLLKNFGGYLQTRKNSNGPTYIDWVKEPGTTSDQKIVLGINMVDLQKEMKADELFTVFVPVGDSGLTIESVNNGKIGIEDTAGIAKYGRIYKTESYSGIKDATELKKLGEAYMTANYKPNKLSIKVKAIDMRLLDGTIDAIKVGSKLTVVSDPHGIEETLTCISVEYDIQNPENNQYEIGDPEETLSQKNHAKAIATEQATTSASHTASHASSATTALEEAVNRHADNILDQASSTYKLEADLAQVRAKCIEIDAKESVKVTTDKLIVNASGEVNISAGGKMVLDSSAYIKLGEDIWIGKEVIEGYDFYSVGESWFKTITVSSGCDAGFFTSEGGGIWTDGTIKNLWLVQADNFIIGGTVSEESGEIHGGQSVSDAVISFGKATATSDGKVNIPYNTFSTSNAGTITFNMADTGWFQAHAVDSVTATRESTIYDSGSSVSATFRLHAKNADGNDIMSNTQTISMDYTPTGGGGSSADVRVGYAGHSTVRSGSWNTAQNFSTLKNQIQAASAGEYIYFDAWVLGDEGNHKTYWFQL